MNIGKHFLTYPLQISLTCFTVSTWKPTTTDACVSINFVHTFSTISAWIATTFIDVNAMSSIFSIASTTATVSVEHITYLRTSTVMLTTVSMLMRLPTMTVSCKRSMSTLSTNTTSVTARAPSAPVYKEVELQYYVVKSTTHFLLRSGTRV